MRNLATKILKSVLPDFGWHDVMVVEKILDKKQNTITTANDICDEMCLYRTGNRDKIRKIIINKKFTSDGKN